MWIACAAPTSQKPVSGIQDQANRGLECAISLYLTAMMKSKKWSVRLRVGSDAFSDSEYGRPCHVEKGYCLVC
jgi:hypothetical protein